MKKMSPEREAIFSTFIIPCLGFVFLPLTTLMYVLLIQGVGGIQGIDWLWLIIAVILDVATLATAGFANRNRLPGVNPGQTYTVVQDPDQSVPSKPAEPKP